MNTYQRLVIMAGVYCAIFLSGCVVEAYRIEVMPPLNVAGRIVDKSGEGIAQQEVKLFVPESNVINVCRYEKDCSPDMTAVEITDGDGLFFHHFPKWTKRASGTHIFIPLKPPNYKHFQIAVEDNSAGQTYVLWVRKRKVDALRLTSPSEPDPQLKESDKTSAIEATVQKKRREWTVQFTLMREESKTKGTVKSGNE